MNKILIGLSLILLQGCTVLAVADAAGSAVIYAGKTVINTVDAITPDVVNKTKWLFFSKPKKKCNEVKLCAAASSTAGNAAGTPQAVAIADPSYALIAPVATIQVAASVIITALLTPLLTAIVFKRNQSKSDNAKPTSEL